MIDSKEKTWQEILLGIKNDKENPPCQDIQDADSTQTI